MIKNKIKGYICQIVAPAKFEEEGKGESGKKSNSGRKKNKRIEEG